MRPVRRGVVAVRSVRLSREVHLGTLTGATPRHAAPRRTRLRRESAAARVSRRGDSLTRSYSSKLELSAIVPASPLSLPRLFLDISCLQSALDNFANNRFSLLILSVIIANN